MTSFSGPTWSSLGPIFWKLKLKFTVCKSLKIEHLWNFRIEGWGGGGGEEVEVGRRWGEEVGEEVGEEMEEVGRGGEGGERRWERPQVRINN